MIDRAYRIDAKLAEGGFGSIYRATHLPTGTVLALKVLRADLATDPTVAARFRRESDTLARLRDPHTVETYQRGETADGTLYIAMELLHGESLKERFEASGALLWWNVLAIMKAVCSSLVEAHAQGIVHRDIKPANIHLGRGDFVKVLDFGVAKVLPWSELDDGHDLTFTGEAVGTIDYMAPEQLAGGVCDARADLYALGVVAYEMITGRRPFADAVGPAGLITMMLTQRPNAASTRCRVPYGVDILLLRCLEREPADRFASATQLIAAIDDALMSQTMCAASRDVAWRGQPTGRSTLVHAAPRRRSPLPPTSEPMPLAPEWIAQGSSVSDIPEPPDAVGQLRWLVVFAIGLIAVAIGLALRL